MKAALRLLARLPLAWLHATGRLVGRLVYFASPTYAARMRENLAQSGIYPSGAGFEGALRACVAESGKGAVEVAKVWFGELDALDRLVRCDTWDVAEQAQREGTGVIFLTPHLGCFELCGLFIAQRVPLTALYRPPRQRWLEPLMLAGRNRGSARLVPANLRGVRALYKALQRGEAVGVLPDQAPQLGEGTWADFFGRPAYTMTLVRRLQKQTGAAVVFVYAERLSDAGGYVVRFERYAGAELDEREMNRQIEALIRRCPTQYLWSYNRYKVPAGADAPAQAART